MIDKLINGFDSALRTVCIPEKRVSDRETPGKDLADITMRDADRKHVAGLVRVNHAGEVCAQALYQGQALTAKLADVRAQMVAAANEEIDHLAWCEDRLAQLDSHVSILNPFWYLGSFLIGATAGVLGDGLSLGFVAETERQVVQHLQRHMARIPIDDLKTKAILEQMEFDEAQHAQTAEDAGAVELPFLVQKLMHITSKLLTFSSYHI